MMPKKPRSNVRRPNERGAILALTGIVLMALLAMTVLGVDLGYVVMVKGELQGAADAASLAAMHALREGRSAGDARQAAVAIASANAAAGQDVGLGGSDVTFGSYNPSSGQFISPPDLAFPAAVRVAARRSDSAPGGPLDLIFGALIGRAEANVSAQAVATIGERQMVIVQDITYSFLQEIGDARNADSALVTAMRGQNLGGEEIGLVTFNEAAQEQLQLTPLHSSGSTITDTISGFAACSSSQLANCAGTHIAPGLDAARHIFSVGNNPGAQKVIVLVSDGMPYPSSRRAPAVAAADRADADGISIFTVTLQQESTGGYGSGGADVAFNAGLVRGFGRAYHTPNSADLDELLLQVLSEIPVALVQ